MGSAALGQLLVWEWRSESYVLKQQVGRAPLSRLQPTGALPGCAAPCISAESTDKSLQADKMMSHVSCKRARRMWREGG